MANRRALVLINGIFNQIADGGDQLIVGAGITTNTGGISISSATGTTTLADNVALATNKNFTATGGTSQFDFSAASGVFRTSTGVNTLNGSQVNAVNVLNAQGGGTGFTVTNNMTVGGTATHTGSLFANGGVDRSTAATLLLGTVNANAITIGSVGVLATVAGNLQVNGTETIVGTSVFQNNAVFDGNVTIGDGSGTDTLDFNATSGRLGSSTNPNVLWVNGVNHLFAVDTATSANNGNNLTIRGGNAGTGNQNGGNLVLDGGALTGSGTGGVVTIGATNASAINIGSASATTAQTGNITHASGTAVFSSNGNSSFSTSSGTLTFSAAGQAELQSTAGNVVVDASSAGTTTFSTGGTSRLIVGAGTITVSPSTTLQTSGTGNINLPNNSSARFQIEGSGVGSTVTAPNLNTLTNGSNADALHTHSGGGGNVNITGTAGESVTQGAPVAFQNNAGTPNVINAQANGSGTRINAVGIAVTSATVGNAISVSVVGAFAIPDGIWDSVPLTSNVGALVYVSENQGKLTLTPPATSGDTQLKLGTVIVGGSGATQIAIQKGEPLIVA